MFNDIFDKLLVLLLVITLPMAIFFTSQHQNQLDEKANEQVNEKQIQKIDQAIKQIQSSSASKKTDEEAKAVPINIDKISFATQSGELKVSGIAPGKNLNIMVSAVVTPIKKEIPKTKIASKSAQPKATESASLDETVLGQSVEVVAVKAGDKGEFSFVKKLDLQKPGILELRFEQGESTATIQYDLSKNKRVL